ncbi:hypothetical protein NDU88_003657 [Pleurodeles waltl]|uniref:Gypsy retrotransposon integrase-like protein 1 n=1 Tax=Pleurodeles waltl TaxID=8319 RepID=A0AAV7W686_PLEWA|nr:hypothetical protein NDU88_003657 [Pleurodeles waltl]
MTKSRLRTVYWWPGLDRDVEAVVKDCLTCARNDKNKVVVKSPLSPVAVPEKPWVKLGLDFMGPFHLLPANERYVMLIVDYTSKWVVTKCVNSVDTRTVIEFLKEEFSREGVPSHLITDNGVQLTSQEMKLFLDSLAVVHLKTALYLPQANGLAERMNRMVKSCVQEAIETRAPLADLLRDQWWAYCNTPNSITGIAPFEYMRGRSGCTKMSPAWFRNKFDLGDLDQEKLSRASDRRRGYQCKYKLRYDYKHGVSSVKWKVGDMVLLKDPGFRTKGKSRFKGPFCIKEVRKNVVVLNNGDVWSMSRIVKWNNRVVDSPDLSPDLREDPSLSGSKATPCIKAPSRLRSRPLWLSDYVP